MRRRYAGMAYRQGGVIAGLYGIACFQGVCRDLAGDRGGSHPLSDLNVVFRTTNMF